MVVPVDEPVHSTRAPSRVCKSVCADSHPVYTAWLLLPAVRTKIISLNLIVPSIQIFVIDFSSRSKTSCVQTFSDPPVTVSHHTHSINKQRDLAAPYMKPTNCWVNKSASISEIFL